MSRTVLVTGATGSFGSAFTRRALGLGWTVRAFSRDEFKQQQLADELPDARWLIGDVRDRDRLRRAAEGCDTIVHAAALKQVVSCEYNPAECVKTNVAGSINVVDAALDAGVSRCVLLSSDKAVHPVNVYGASKLCAEKLWLAAGAYAGSRDIRFSVVRYGNVRGSRGSVLAKPGVVRLTDRRATRFWMNVEEAVDLVLLALDRMRGGEVFVPKLSSSLIADVVDHDGEETGLHPGEKLHESLISDEEIPRTYDCGGYYLITREPPEDAVPVAEGFRYTSETAMCGVSG